MENEKNVYFLVFEPMKYNWKILPVQVLIQIRTWGKATHVGMIYDEEKFEEFMDYISKHNWLTRKFVLERFEKAGLMVSATFPKVKVENVFTDYVNDRIFIKKLTVSDYQYAKIHKIWNDRIGKQGYSLLGLIWFAVAPFVDWIKKTKDIDPHKGFCSEVATNVLYASGVKVFSFMCNKFENDLLEARSMPKAEYIQKYKTIQGMTAEEFWNFANKTRNYYFGYKVSPRVFKLSPIFDCLGYLEITKNNVIYVR